MHRHTLSETCDMASTRSSRAPSFSSDRPSVASSVTFQMPTTVRPLPAYIAASVASQIVTDHHNAQLREHDADSDELQNAVFSEQALSLLNAFLDHLLFAFLSTARSPSLTAIRPAIADVLKPRLAREATEAADEELQGLLAGEDEEEFPAHDGKAVERWDVEKVWKRTRLRIMVYTRLGELEDEDEEKYVSQERGLSMDDDQDDEAGLVSWASAIFLTSVIEYIAEQTLLAAGSAAFARMAAKMKKLSRELEDADEPSLERLVIEESDAEKIALNSALGRLWRTWRKRVRSPMTPMSPGRGIRPVSSYSSLHRRKLSYDTVDEYSAIPEHTPTETEIAANISLPMGENDVNEIEVPGLARTYETDDEGSGMQTPVPRRQRPSSVILAAPEELLARRTTRERPLSMPVPIALPFTVPAPSKVEPEEVEMEARGEIDHEVEGSEAETPFETPMEYGNKRKSYMEPQETPALPGQPKAEDEPAIDESSQEADADMVAFAASTGMGFRMSTVDPISTKVPVEEDEPEIPSAGGYESEPKIMNSKRMSVEKTGPPGIVRTFSTRSVSLRSAQNTPTPGAKATQHAEGRSYLDDAASTDDETEQRAIGIARTSDIPIRSTPTPPVDAFSDRGKSASHGGYVEVQPRQTAPTSIAVRSTPSPDAKPTIPDRAVARKDLHKRDVSSESYTTTSNQFPSVTSAPRKSDVPPPSSRVVSLPSLREVDTQSSNSKPRLPSEATPTSPHSPLYRENSFPSTTRHVQRVSTDESKRSHRGAPDSPSSAKSGVQRVGSSSSSGKKSGSFSAKHTGRDSQASQRSQVLRSRMSEEDREREFDSLVKGEETVKFTLTPQTVRDIDELPVQKKVEPSRSTPSTVTVHPRVNADKDNAFGTGSLPTRSTSRSTGPVPAQHKSSPSRKVVTRPLAREPRVESESLRDFADFIRSTGPTPGQEKPVQPFVNISGNGPRPSNVSSSSLGRKTSTKQNGALAADSMSSKARMNMEPRSPAGLSKGNDDLIDFIRQGPPSNNHSQPRIPRSVAPFRSTVDSDQFDTMLGGHGNVESAYGSTASTLDSKHSAQTINSRTGLLPEPKVLQPAYSNTPQKLSGNMASGPEPQITKTRRRIKDPYAIDVSDDEDEDQLTALPPSKTIAAAKARANASNSTLSSQNTATRNGTFGATSTSVASDAPRAYKPRLQARSPAAGEARSGKTSTSDLADFLRNSGPTEPAPLMTPANGKKDEEKKRRFWSRKKAVAE